MATIICYHNSNCSNYDKGDVKKNMKEFIFMIFTKLTDESFLFNLAVIIGTILFIITFIEVVIKFIKFIWLIYTYGKELSDQEHL